MNNETMEAGCEPFNNEMTHFHDCFVSAHVAKAGTHFHDRAMNAVDKA